MADAPIIVASAVIVPEHVEQPASASAQAKRRQSSTTEQNAKIPRLNPPQSSSAGSPTADPPGRAVDRRKSGQLEERKRGQRLFGALLGTLSQSSSSTAQKRRTDIERKQQAKLKLQNDEFDEKKKQLLDTIMDFRRREQKKYDKQSMQIRHSNLLAQAQFLKTRAEPQLYYKPWELLPREENEIKSQIGQAERDIERETEQFEIDNPPEGTNGSCDEQLRVEGSKAQPEASERVGPNTNQEAKRDIEEPTTTNPKAAAESVITEPITPLPEASKDHNDDGGEVVEGDEDTVIY